MSTLQSPIVLLRNLTNEFDFWMNGALRKGMRHNENLYGALCTFDRQNRDQAYNRASRFIRQGMDVVVTVSDRDYTIWANLRHLSSPEMVAPEQQFVPQAA